MAMPTWRLVKLQEDDRDPAILHGRAVASQARRRAVDRVGDERRTRRILIDGGPLHAWPTLAARIGKLPAGDQRIELLVITHVDTDHIEGIIRLLALPRAKWPLEPMDIWFNGFSRSRRKGLGGREGEFLSALIHRRAFDEWNQPLGRGRRGRAPATGGHCPAGRDGMVLTLLSPDKPKLTAMGKRWQKRCGAVGSWTLGIWTPPGRNWSMKPTPPRRRADPGA